MSYPELVQKFLEEHRVAALAVVDAAGVPHGSALHYAWDDASDTCIFFTRTGTVKYKIVAQGPAHASLVIGFDETEFVTMQMHGEARVGVSDSARAAYFKKFPDIREYEHDNDAAFISFTPAWWRYSDYKIDPPKIISS